MTKTLSALFLLVPLLAYAGARPPSFPRYEALFINQPTCIDGRHSWFPNSGRTSANQTMTVRRQVLVQQAASDLQVLWANSYRTNSTTVIANSNSIVIKASLELNGNITPIFFQGKRTVTIDGGGVVTSDIIPVYVTPSDTVYVRTYFDCGSGGSIPVGVPFWGSGSTGTDMRVNGSDLVDQVGTSGMAAVSSLSLYYSHSSVIGVPVTWKPGIALVGDSIMQGINDVTYPQDSTAWKQPQGFANRALQPAGFGAVWVACGGECAWHVTTGSLPLRLPLINGAQVAICDYGINDLSGASNNTLTNLQANVQKIWAYFRGRGLKVFQTTLVPQTTSTDKWYTQQNQTVKSWETNRLNFNAWLRDSSTNGAMASGLLTGIFDTASMIETNGVWIVTSNLVYSGTLTSATASNATDTNQVSIGLHTLDGQAILKTTGGTGSGQVVQITANSPNNMYYVSPNFSPTPDATTTYQIWSTPTADGVHPNRLEYIRMATMIDTNLLTWP